MITRKFIKSSFIYTLAGAMPLASAVVLLPFYIGYLPTDVYGALSLYLAFSLFVQIVVVFSFDSSTYLHYHDFKNDPTKLSSFLSSAFIFMLLTGAVVGTVLVLIGEFAFTLIFKDPKISFYPFGLMSVAIGIFQALFKVYCNILQSREKPELFLRSNATLFILIAGLTIAGLHLFPGTLVGPIGGRLVAGGIVSGWALSRVFNEFGFKFNFPLLRSTFNYNQYTFIYQIQQWGINYLDRFLMLLFLPLSSVGVYDFAIKCLIVIEFILNGLHNSFYPKVVSALTSQTVKGSTTEVNRYYHGLTAVIMILVSTSIFVLPFLLEFFESKQGYRDATQYFPYIAASYMLRIMRLYFTVPFGILKYTKPLPAISLVVSVIKIILMILLIREYEIYGVILSAIISATLELPLLKRAINQKFHFHINIFKMIIAPLVLLFLILILEPLFGERFGWQLHLLYVLVTAGFLLWVYRNELKLVKFSKILD